MNDQINSLLSLIPISVDAGLIKRKQIFNKLCDLTKKWNLKLYLFGSFNLGLYTKDCDLDILCVGTCNFTHDLFFKNFARYIKTFVENCIVIEKSRVPLIKIYMEGVSIDLVFAALDFEEFPENFNLFEYKNFDSITNKTYLFSLNGVQVNNFILKTVPNVKNFRILLYIIKHWAKEQGIYSNALGYLGGVSWTILVTFICIKFPGFHIFELLIKFFEIFSKWDWTKPVTLNDYYFGDTNVMSIITPVYPNQNAAYNVIKSTKRIIEMKLNEGFEKINKFSSNNLFKSQYFFDYSNYFVFTVLSGHSEWPCFVESKIRIFLKYVEQQSIIDLLHVNTKHFAKNNTRFWFIGIKLNYSNVNLDLKNYVQYYKQSLFSSFNLCTNRRCCNICIDFATIGTEKWNSYCKFIEYN